jgi:DNA-binding MarR family transcriptional regulator
MKAYKLGSVNYRSGYAASVALAQAGKSNKEIAEILKITPQSVSAALERSTIRELHQMDKPKVMKGKGKTK